MENLDFSKSFGIHTFLYGETNTKKTYTTAKFIDYLVSQKDINTEKISILDFAPPMRKFNGLKIGGKISDFSKKSSRCNNIKIDYEIIPARLNANNREELYKYICHNYKLTSKALNRFIQEPTQFLIMNDMSIYLHLGNKFLLLKTILSVNTFFGNSYYGKSIKKKFGTLLSIKERKRVEFLIKNIENSISTD